MKKLTREELIQLNEEYVDALRHMSSVIDERNALQDQIAMLKASLEKARKRNPVHKVEYLEALNVELISAISHMHHKLCPSDPFHAPMDEGLDTPEEVKRYLAHFDEMYERDMEYIIKSVVWHEVWNIEREKRRKEKAVKL